jgi:hypothetical protein
MRVVPLPEALLVMIILYTDIGKAAVVTVRCLGPPVELVTADDMTLSSILLKEEGMGLCTCETHGFADKFGYIDVLNSEFVLRCDMEVFRTLCVDTQ